MRTIVCLLVLALILPSCAGGGLKASTVKPYTDTLAANLPLLIDEALPLIPEEKRAKFEEYGRIVTAAMLAMKTAVDMAAAAEKSEIKLE